jgi:dephospho-CoA kinase
VIGLTGGIASGKSAVAQRLRDRGAVVVDADVIAREVVEPGQPALAALVERFGAGVLGADGRLDRGRLAAIVFADPEARAAINAITHPRIIARSTERFRDAAAAGAGVVFYEAALLVETGRHQELDGLVVVLASPAVQERRLIDRDGHTPEAARARIAAQLPAAAKRAAATWVIENDGELAALDRRVDEVVAAIEARFGPIRPVAA